MTILESPLMGEFIEYLKSTWGGNSRVNQRRRRLRQLVAMVQGVADAAGRRAALTVRGSPYLYLWLELLREEALRGQAVLDATSDPSAVVGSAKKFLAGVKALFVCSAEVDRLTDAVEALERLAGPGADLDLFLKAMGVAAAANMDVDDDDAPAVAPAHCVEEGSYSVATAPGAKRKRSRSSGVDQAGDGGDGDGEAASRQRNKRRTLACKRHTSSGPPLPAGPGRSVAVAMAMPRVRRRIVERSLGRTFSQISLQCASI
ncbi:unnamed protein product [Alopecurus aequalis]